MTVFAHLRRISPAARRFAAVALLALQATLVLAPMWEPAGTVMSVTHIEELGARHFDVHDDATCAVCQWRLMDSAPAAPTHLSDALVQRHAVPADMFALGPSRELSLGRRTRAPPQNS